MIPHPLFFSLLSGTSLVLTPSGHQIVMLVSFSAHILSSQGFFAMCIYSDVSVFNIVSNYIPFKTSSLCVVCLCFPNIEGIFPYKFSLENLWLLLQLLNLYNYNIIFYFSLQLLLFILFPLIWIDGTEVYFLLTLVLSLCDHSRAFLLGLI